MTRGMPRPTLLPSHATMPPGAVRASRSLPRPQYSILGSCGTPLSIRSGVLREGPCVLILTLRPPRDSIGGRARTRATSMRSTRLQRCLCCHPRDPRGRQHGRLCARDME